MKKKKLGELITEFREEHGLSMTQFAKQSGLSKAYISMLEKNMDSRTKKPITPSIETIRAVGEVMHVDLNSMIDLLDNNTLVSVGKQKIQTANQKSVERIAKLYTQLNPTGQDKVCGYAQDLIDTGAYEPKSLQETISAYTIASVAAGIGIDNSQVDPRFRTYGTTELPKHDFCVDVSGDSMFPTICDGDTAFCVTNFERLNGKIYVVSINGEEVIKRCYFETDQLTLVSDNEEYDDRIITGYDLETVRIVGYVVGWETPI